MFSNFAELDLAALPSLAGGAARAHRVSLVAATAASLRGYGSIVTDFAAARVTIVTWPQPGWRPVVSGTGNEGGIVEDSFEMVRRGGVPHPVNPAVRGSYLTRWFAPPARGAAKPQGGGRPPNITHPANIQPPRGPG